LELQIEQTATQRYQLDVKVKELERTLKELKEVPDGTEIFKNSGVVIYRVQDRQKLISELEEQKELSEIRLKTLERQQKSLEDKYKELEDSLRRTYDEQRKGKSS
jgi:prefoldin beta subunit